MNDRDREFLDKLREAFKLEAAEHLETITSGLIALEKDGGQASVLEGTFRAAHSLKGAARAVNAAEVETLCQSMESVFAALKRSELSADAGLLDALERGAELLGEILPAVGTALGGEARRRVEALAAELDAIGAGNPPGGAAPPAGGAEAPAVVTPEPESPAQLASRPEPPSDGRGEPSSEPPSEAAPEPPTEPSGGPAAALVPSIATAETVRVPVARLDRLMLQAEELLLAKLAAAQQAAALREAAAAFVKRRREFRAARGALRELVKSASNGANGAGAGHNGVDRLLAVFDGDEAAFEDLAVKLNALARDTGVAARGLGTMVDRLLGGMRQVLMLPCGPFLEMFPRAARSLAREQGKEVEVVVHGGELEIDRRVLEGLKDALLHLLRNCVDHGVEKPEARIASGKPPRATIALSVSPLEGDKVRIRMSDDGAGVSTEKLRRAALKASAIGAQEAAALDERVALELMFLSGISTSAMITDISGRGLGLAIVREKLEKLGGRISVETEAGRGTTFDMVLPVTLATFRGSIVRAGDQVFVLPTLAIERVVGLKEASIHTVSQRTTLELGDATVPLVRLGDVLRIPAGSAAGGLAGRPAVVVEAAGKRVAFVVDAVLGEQEILAKSLGKQLTRVRNVFGATVLGTGRVAVILNASDLVASAAHVSMTADAPAAQTPATRGEGPRVLLAEDSVTARGLLKSILEGAGYRVRTAVDGLDAWTALKLEEVDLVVSDVEMPRMDGFDLTTRIRADRTLEDLPVVLVTALESREHRERGADVGANAYIVKSTFEKSNLLEVVSRLV